MAAQPIDYTSFLKHSNNTGKKYHCVSHKRLIAKACIETLESKDVHVRDKLKAASILERLGRERDLASRRRKKMAENRLTKRGTVTQSVRLGDILESASDNN